MLHVYHSNRLEVLFTLLCAIRESQPVPDPLKSETVMVANPGIGRWLNLQIADHAGIAANIDYVLPAEFVWHLYRKCLNSVPKKSAFERSALQLRVLTALDVIAEEGDKVWTPLQRYISDDGSTIGDIKRVQLATRIADLFDQYLVYRPQMLLNWEKDSDELPVDDSSQLWQPALWRRLSRSIEEPHRASLWQQFCTLADNGQIHPSLVPGHLHLFNVGLLPPSTLDVLVRLPKIDNEDAGRASLYFLNPAIDYWGDLLDMRRAARERLKLDVGDSPLSDDKAGNPLLSSLGRSGQTLMRLLSDRSEWVDDEQFFLPAAGGSLLSAVHADLLRPYEDARQNTPVDLSTVGKNIDESIQLHQCYSPMREVQALHDRLLDRFNADASLTPADVVVMVPDINKYAPVIEAVFGSVGSEVENSACTRYIPWAIADRGLMEVSRVVACVQRLFELPGFEFEATGVLGFAAEPAIARRFGFDESALKTLNEWLDDSGIRRTLAGNHSEILKEPQASLHSWDFGLRRLLLGRAMPADSGAVGETLPGVQVDGQEAVLLSQLLSLLEALEETRLQLSKSYTPTDWVRVVDDMTTRLLQPDEDEADALKQFREILNDFDADALRAGQTGTMTHATFAEILRGMLAGAQRKNHRYLTGRVTFSSMVPLRSVPFRIVCMLGLNDSDFPRQRPSPGFDLISQDPRPGDRSVRDDDRYLFLEAMLSARDELYLSWIYRNASDNAPREPSVLVSELRDYLSMRHPLQLPRCIEHPLQPFSASLFDANRPELQSFATEWAPPPIKTDSVTITETGITAAPDTQISLDDFQRFWRNPSNWYCRRVLGIALWRDDQEPLDTEPFDFDGLASYQLRDDLVGMLLQDPTMDQEKASRYLQRRGALPHGGLGELTFNSFFEEAHALIRRVAVHETKPLPVVDIDISVSGQQLLGQLHDVASWPDGKVGVLQYRVAALKGHHLSALWLVHLIGSAAGVLTGSSLLVTKDKEREIAAIERQDALKKLEPWFEGWNTGHHTALPFFAKTSAVLAGAVKGTVNSVWPPPYSDIAGPGESEEEAIQLLYSKVDDLPNRPDVLDWAEKLLGDEVLKS